MTRNPEVLWQGRGGRESAGKKHRGSKSRLLEITTGEGNTEKETRGGVGTWEDVYHGKTGASNNLGRHFILSFR